MIGSSLLLFLAVNVPTDQTWPGWRGTQATGTADGSPPTHWSETENIRFKVELAGKGLSSPVVHGDRIFLSTAIPTATAAEPAEEPSGDRPAGRGGAMRMAKPIEHDFVVMALSLADGSIVWQTTVRTATPHEGTHADGSFATPTLATDGHMLLASFGSSGVFGLTLDGDLAWESDLGDMAVQGGFGEGSSPLLHQDTALILWDHEGDSFLIALDTSNGDVRWRAPQPQGTNWSTPILIEVEGQTQVVVVGASRTIAYDVSTGAEIWSLGTAAAADDDEPRADPAPTGSDNRGDAGGRAGRGGGRGAGNRGRGGSIASPVAAGGMVFLPMSGALGALRPAGKSGALDPATAFAWTETRDLPGVASPIAYDGLLYVMKSGGGILSAFDGETGERVYGPERLVGVQSAYASPIAAGGNIYLLGRDGGCEVVAAGREFKSLAVNELDDRFDASPAVVGDALLLRGHHHLYCIAAD